MLTLADARPAGGDLAQISVFRDVALTGDGRGYTSTYYVLRDRPVLAVDAAGGPAYHLYRYRRAPGLVTPDGAAGGLLVLTVSLAPTDAERAALPDAIRRAYGLRADDPVDVVDLPVDAATVELSLAGETAGGEFVDAVLGNGEAGTATTVRSTFAVRLTADGATLLDTAMRSGLALLRAGVRVTFTHHLDDVRVRVWCDSAGSIDVAHGLAALGPVTPAQLLPALLQRRLAGSTVESARVLADDERAQLDALARAVLGEALVGTVVDADGNPRPYDRTVESRLNVTLTGTYPVRRTVAGAAVLSLPADPIRVSAFDLGSWPPPFVTVQVSVAGDLAANGVDTVRVTLAPEADQQAEVAQTVFRPGDAAAVLRFDPGPGGGRRYLPRVAIGYRHDPVPYRVDLPLTDADQLVLDADAVGVLRVDVLLGLAPPGATAVVELAYRASGGPTTRLVLDGTHPGGSWLAVVRERPGPYRFRVDWVTDDGRVPGEWQESTGRRLLLDAPAGLGRRAEVTLVPAGSFDAVAMVVVDLRAGLDGPVSTFAFTATGTTSTWPVPAGAGPVRYQVRRTVVRLDGSRQAEDWHDDDRPVLIVRDTGRFDVTVVPALLDLGGQHRLALVELVAIDGDPVNGHTTVVLRGPQERPIWTIRPADPDKHAYRYRLTLVDAAGPHAGAWREETSSVLVLRPDRP